MLTASELSYNRHKVGIRKQHSQLFEIRMLPMVDVYRVWCPELNLRSDIGGEAALKVPKASATTDSSFCSKRIPVPLTLGNSFVGCYSSKGSSDVVLAYYRT